MTVRRATEFADAWAIYQLLLKMHAESAYADIPQDEDAALSTIWATIKADDAVALMDEDKDGRLVGVLMGAIQTHWFSSTAKYVVDTGFYVDPARRGGLSGARLIRALDAWAKEQGVTDMMFGVTAGIDNDRAAGLIRALGYSDFGLILRKVG